MNTKNYDFGGFKSIRISGAVKVAVIRSAGFKVCVTCDDPEHVRAEQIGDTLALGRRGIDWLVPFHMQPEFQVEMPELRSVKIRGACQGEITGFASSGDIELDVSGASHLDFKDISAANSAIKISGASHVNGNIYVTGKTELKINGASHVDLVGSTKNMELECSGASHAGLSGFRSESADIKLTGASKASVDVKGTMNTDLDGASDLRSAGSPQMGTVAVSGASTLRRR